MAHEQLIHDASERRAAELEKISSKGAREGQKVKQAAAKLQAEADELASQLRTPLRRHIPRATGVPFFLAAHRSLRTPCAGEMQSAAEERRASQLDAIAAKGAAVSHKVKQSADVLKQEMEFRASALHHKLERAEG